jgi:hypothetical protein
MTHLQIRLISSGRDTSFKSILPRPVTKSFLKAMHNPLEGRPGKKKKKVDIEALTSPLKRIPGMDLSTVRDLLDIGIEDIDELRGRSPEALLEEIFNLREQTPRDRLSYLRMAVYYAETDEPDPRLLEAWKWKDSTVQD